MELTNQTPGTYLGMYAADKLPPASTFLPDSYALVDGAYLRSTGSAWVPLDATFGLAPTGKLSSSVESQTDITGNAGTATLAAEATKLATARTINGVAFDGTANIEIEAAAEPVFTDFVDVGSLGVTDAGVTITASEGAELQFAGDPVGTSTAALSAVDVSSFSITVQKPDASPGPMSISTSILDLTGNTFPIKLKLDNTLGTEGQVPTADAAGAVTWRTHLAGNTTLVAGTKDVLTAAVTANSIITVTTQSLGTVAVPTPLAVTARSAGVSFTITSADATDTSVVGWTLQEPTA